MCQNHNVVELFSDVLHIFNRELLMDLATPTPADHLIIEYMIRLLPFQIPAGFVQLWKDDVLSGLTSDVPGQVLVRNKDHSVGLERVNYSGGVRRSAADIRFGFHVSVCVDIGDYRHAGKSAPQFAHVRGGNA